MLHDGQEDKPWIGAGLGASVLLIGAVLLREVILRNARNRFQLRQRMLSEGLIQLPRESRTLRDSDKVTIERNDALLRHIRQKSQAAKVLASLAPAHREVFDLCEQYLRLIDREIPSIGVGSPRLPVLLRGSESVKKLHKYHLLKWTEIESQTSMQDARARSKLTEKIDSAEKALNSVEFALRHYPSELSLRESSVALREMIAAVKVEDLLERADRAEFKGHLTRAISLRQDALFLIDRLGFTSAGLVAVAERINGIIERTKSTLIEDQE